MMEYEPTYFSNTSIITILGHGIDLLIDPILTTEESSFV